MTTTFTSDKWVVIVGAWLTGVTGFLRVSDVKGGIDQFGWGQTASFTAAAPTNVASTFNTNIGWIVGLPRRMLCPPGAIITFSGDLQALSCIECDSLTDALMIL